jgi:hypothetical protein
VNATEEKVVYVNPDGDHIVVERTDGRVVSFVGKRFDYDLEKWVPVRRFVSRYVAVTQHHDLGGEA